MRHTDIWEATVYHFALFFENIKDSLMRIISKHPFIFWGLYVFPVTVITISIVCSELRR